MAAGLMLGAALTLGYAITAVQAAPPPACTPSITACGCVINQAGIYIVADDLNASQTTQPNCIEISAPHVILNLEGARVIGNNAGIGILIDQGATSAIVEGGNEADNNADGSTAAVRQAEAVVSQWNIGIDDDADDAVIELFDAIGGVALLPSGHTPGNVTGGVFLNGVKHSLIGDFRANFNGTYGVRLRAARMSPLQTSRHRTTARPGSDSNRRTATESAPPLPPTIRKSESGC